jgi:hypothetical protein
MTIPPVNQKAPFDPGNILVLATVDDNIPW